MKTKRVIVSILTILIITGCAYRSAMNDGKKMFEVGQYDDAIRYFEKAIQKKPQSADATIWLKKSKE
ncbi:MAG: tetratricopeptide repeat protein, partial [Deltaproteobacteria bacterium]|nr:tetratricopeptide repeat protein [Deltaproteobacteria bacterium]